MILILVRHGEVIDKENPNLTRLGRLQVMKLAKRLKKEKIDYVYSSNLKRAIQTAKIIAKERSQEIKFTPLIREIPDEIIERHRKYWKNKKLNNKRLKEIRKFIKKLEKKHKNETVLLIGHAKVNRAIIHVLTGLNLYDLYILKQYHACINILKKEKLTGKIRKDKVWRIILLNSVEHLPKKFITALNKKNK